MFPAFPLRPLPVQVCAAGIKGGHVADCTHTCHTQVGTVLLPIRVWRACVWADCTQLYGARACGPLCAPSPPRPSRDARHTQAPTRPGPGAIAARFVPLRGGVADRSEYVE